VNFLGAVLLLSLGFSKSGWRTAASRPWASPAYSETTPCWAA
jgi:hypothetical protein